MFSLLPAALAALSLSSIASAQYIAIRGISDGVVNGSRPARLNINTLQADPYAWPLYIQALTAMQNDPTTSPTSYFEISGIHGRPYKAWDNIEGQYPYTGYCTHDSILFPSWHRPYLGLFEQQLNAYAKAIALQYNGSDKAKWQAAATTLRMPYWDWAATPALPAVMNTPKITIFKPQGKTLVNNPLFSFRMPKLDPNFFPTSGAFDSYLAKDPSTVRDSNANANMENAGLTPATYNLFSRISDYSTFATQAVSGSSLEAVHGSVHVNVGGQSGHMSQLSYAAYDPIFWLHHTNVDRIFALWQATHPESYIPSGGVQDAYGTYTIAPNSVDDSSTALTPFTASTDGKMWDSDTARYMSTWGYTYPELSDWTQTPQQLAANVTAIVNAMYGPKTPANRRSHPRDISTMKSQEWFVEIKVDKFDLDSSFQVLVFLGDAPADAGQYKGAANLAGSLFVSLPPSNRPEKTPMSTHGEVSLKAALENAALPDYSEGNVISYLTKNLQWKIQKTDGTVVDPSACRSLVISVQSEEVTPPQNEYGFPKYGEPIQHPEITKGKKGGD